jgi:hypothetical protein
MILWWDPLAFLALAHLSKDAVARIHKRSPGHPVSLRRIFPPSTHSLSFDMVRRSPTLATLLILVLAATASVDDAASTADTDDICSSSVPRNTLLASCGPCGAGAACIVYDQDPAAPKLTGCDFETGSSDAFCTNENGRARSCEFECFSKLRDASTFAFVVPFKTALPASSSRRPPPPSLQTTDTVPFQSNVFVDAIGPLNIPATVSKMCVPNINSYEPIETLVVRWTDVCFSVRIQSDLRWSSGSDHERPHGQHDGGRDCLLLGATALVDHAGEHEPQRRHLECLGLDAAHDDVPRSEEHAVESTPRRGDGQVYAAHDALAKCERAQLDQPHVAPAQLTVRFQINSLFSMGR